MTPSAKRENKAMHVVAQLQLFLERVQELEGLRLIRGWESGIEVRYQHGEPTTFEFHEPDEEDLRSFLLSFRQFLSDREPVFMLKVYNVCFLHLRSDELRAKMIDSRARWMKALSDSGLRLEVDGKVISPEKALKLWINGHYFHSNHEMRELLKAFGPIERGLTRQQFLKLIGDGIIQLLFTAGVIEEALRAELIEA